MDDRDCHCPLQSPTDGGSSMEKVTHVTPLLLMLVLIHRWMKCGEKNQTNQSWQATTLDLLSLFPVVVDRWSSIPATSGSALRTTTAVRPIQQDRHALSWTTHSASRLSGSTSSTGGELAAGTSPRHWDWTLMDPPSPRPKCRHVACCSANVLRRRHCCLEALRAPVVN